MNTIQLTKDQRSKLLEIANSLFNKSIEWEWLSCGLDDHSGYDDDNLIIIDEIIRKTKGRRDWRSSIHWFEFCMTHLHSALSLLNPVTDQDKLDNLWIAMGKYNAHPVDYLYTEFKKLQK